MSNLTPERIFNSYQDGEMDKISTIKYLKSIIENCETTRERIKSLEYLEQMDIKDENSFKFLENLIISDSSEKIRAKSLEIFIKNYFEIGKDVIEWLIEKDQSLLCLVSLIRCLDLLKIVKKSKVTIQIIKKYLKNAEEQIKEKIKNEKYVDFLWKLYKNMELDTNERIILLRKLMEQIIGEKYIKNYKILPREAMALGLLERELGEELIDGDEYPSADEHYATFRARLIPKFNDYKNLHIHVIDIGIHSRTCKKIEFLELLPRLRVFSVFYSKLEQIDGLEFLSELETLNLTANPIDKLPNLSNLKQLKSLYLGSTNISELNGIEELKNLERIEMEESEIPELMQEQIENLIRSNR